MPLISATLALASLAICVLWFRLGQRDSIRLPPGPSRLPLLGSVHHLPQEYQHKKFFELAKTHGLSRRKACGILCLVPVL